MFIDIHGHTYSRTAPRDRALTNMLAPENLIAQWPAFGIDCAVLLPLVHHECLPVLQTNEDILDVCAQFPGKFIPFCNLDPRYHYNNPSVDFTPVLEHYQSLGCKGVGEMCANLRWDDPRVLNMLGHIEKSGLPLLFHVGTDGGTYGLVDEPGLPKLELVLQRFPKLQFIGHSPGIWSNISGDATAEGWMGYPTGPVTAGGRLPELLRQYPNLWADISAGSGNNALVRDPEFGWRFMEEFQDQLLFGTDICHPNQDTPQVETLNNAFKGGHISKAAYEKITHLNDEKLLAL